jgi:hypothetical protein
MFYCENWNITGYLRLQQLTPSVPKCSSKWPSRCSFEYKVHDLSFRPTCPSAGTHKSSKVVCSTQLKKNTNFVDAPYSQDYKCARHKCARHKSQTLCNLYRIFLPASNKYVCIIVQKKSATSVSSIHKTTNKIHNVLPYMLVLCYTTKCCYVSQCTWDNDERKYHIILHGTFFVIFDI